MPRYAAVSARTIGNEGYMAMIEQVSLNDKGKPERETG